MSVTMRQFMNAAEAIRRVRKQEELIKEKFTKSTCELSECFQYILNAEIKGDKCCYLFVDICPELYAKELHGMGFDVEEKRNDYNDIIGYNISWEGVNYMGGYNNG